MKTATQTSASFNYITLVRDFLGRAGRTETQGQQNLLRYYSARNNKGQFNPGMELIERDTGLCQQTITEFNSYFRRLGILTWKKGYKNAHMDKGVSNLYQLDSGKLQELTARANSSTTGTGVVLEESSTTGFRPSTTGSTTGSDSSTTGKPGSTTPVAVPKNQALKESSISKESNIKESSNEVGGSEELLPDSLLGSLYKEQPQNPTTSDGHLFNSNNSLRSAFGSAPSGMSDTKNTIDGQDGTSAADYVVTAAVEGLIGTATVKRHEALILGISDNSADEIVESIEAIVEQEAIAQERGEKSDVQLLVDESCITGPGYLNDFVFRCYSPTQKRFIKVICSNTKVPEAELRQELLAKIQNKEIELAQAPIRGQQNVNNNESLVHPSQTGGTLAV